LRRAAGGEGRAYLRLDQASNRSAHLAGAGARAARSGAAGEPASMVPVRTGRAGTVVAVGPMLDRVLEATSGFDVAVLYATTVRPFDAATLRATLGRPEVVVVEPYLAWTSAGVVAAALADLPHRVLCLGVGRDELRRYGTVAEHDRAHGLDAAGLRAAIGAFLGL
jgi:transketolase